MLDNIEIIISKIKNVVFDFDGVIAETDTARFNILSKILSKYSIDLRDEYSILDIVGIPTDIFLKNNYSELSSTDILDIVRERRAEIINNLDNSCLVYPGAKDTILGLVNRNYKMYLATTNERTITEKMLDFIGIIGAFETLYCRDDIMNKKSSKKDYGILIKKQK